MVYLCAENLHICADFGVTIKGFKKQERTPGGVQQLAERGKESAEKKKLVFMFRMNVTLTKRGCPEPAAVATPLFMY